MKVPFVPKKNGADQAPIVGLPFTVISYVVLPLIHCNCAHGESLQLTIAQSGDLSIPSKCGGCGYSYIVQGMAISADGKLMFGIATLPPNSEAPS